MHVCVFIQQKIKQHLHGVIRSVFITTGKFVFCFFSTSHMHSRLSGSYAWLFLFNSRWKGSNFEICTCNFLFSQWRRGRVLTSNEELITECKSRTFSVVRGKREGGGVVFLLSWLLRSTNAWTAIRARKKKEKKKKKKHQTPNPPESLDFKSSWTSAKKKRKAEPTPPRPLPVRFLFRPVLFALCVWASGVSTRFFLNP